MSKMINFISEMKNIPSKELQRIVDRDPKGISPSFGRQIIGARKELQRRKRMK